MAFAQSSKKGQSIVSCKLCLTDPKVLWKCQECDVLMCNRCKETIHPNIKNAKNHKVLNIKEVGVKTEDISTVQCKHKSRDCVMYCKTCEQFVCPLCIPEVHSSHELAKISEGLQIHTERLKKGQNQMKKHLDKLTKHGAKIEEIKKNEKIKYMEAKKKIQARNKTLKKQVDQYTEEIIKELDQQWKLFTDSFEKQESHVVTLKQNNKEKNQQVEKALSSNDLEKIYEESKTFESLKENFDLPEIEIKFLATFTPGEINNYNFGSLLDISSDISIKVRKEFTTGIDRVGYMSPSNDDDSLWISDANKVHKVKTDGNKLQTISSYNIKNFGIAVTPSERLLFTTSGSVLKQINSSGEITDSVYSVDPLIITAVHVTRDNKIIVGAWSGRQLFPATGNRVVIVMDEGGRKKVRNEYDQYDNRLYTYPFDITKTNNGNICVVDHLSADGTGRIVVTEMDGCLINIYTGIPDVNTDDNPFRPRSVTRTPSDNLVIPDRNAVLHILNNNGQQITYIKVGDIGILYPYTVSFTLSGKSYIGCTTNQSTNKYAKLLEVQLKGF